MKKKKVQDCWDDCRTKEEKQAFIDNLEMIGKTSRCIPFDKVIFDQYVKEAAKTKTQRKALVKELGKLKEKMGKLAFDDLIFDRYMKVLPKRCKRKHKMKDTIKNKNGLNVSIEHKNIMQKSRIFCDRIEYLHDRGRFLGHPVFDHHLMFWLGRKLVFKVWLRQDKEYKDIDRALKDVGIKVLED